MYSVNHSRWGERVHAVIVTHPGAQVTEEEIRGHVKTLIAGYKALRTVEFVDTLPATPTGKNSQTGTRIPSLGGKRHGRGRGTWVRAA